MLLQVIFRLFFVAITTIYFFFRAGYKNNDIGYNCQYFTFRKNPNPNLNLPTPECEISPVTGDIFTPFNVNCTINTTFCSGDCSFYLTTSKGKNRHFINITNCYNSRQYDRSFIYFFLSTGKYVYQGNQNNMPNLFLPPGNIKLTVTVKNNARQTTSTTLDVQVSHTFCFQY